MRDETGIDNSVVPPTENLRRAAEKRVNPNPSVVHQPKSREELLKLVHELEVHQIELDMQNEELVRALADLEASQNNFIELYDFAPIGYFTFDGHGTIEAANLTAAQLLGVERGSLHNTPFSRFIADADGRKVFSDHLALIQKQQVILKCEIKIKGHDGITLHGQFQSIFVRSEHTTGHTLTSFIDGTTQKQLRNELQESHDNLEVIIGARTKDLTSANLQLSQEVFERKQADASLQKAFSEIKLLKNRLQAENTYLQHEVSEYHNFGEIIGRSPSILHVFSQVDQVAAMNATVLLLGETGTGKGIVARAIHSNSERKKRQMVTVNCATLPTNLIESELFGREKGAFTGSDSRQIGRFELADGGTLFLDEIGELPMEMQSKLLRVIQDGEFERLGNPRTIKIDVRIIAATNRNLEEEVKNGKFREDLFYRLNVFPITIPSLRQRVEDIPILLNYFIAKFNKKIGKKIDIIPKSCMDMLMEYRWPGNVRELESVIERAIIISQGNTLQILDHFDMSSVKEKQTSQDVKALVELEHDHVLEVLKKTGWRIEGKNGAAGLLGLNPSTLRARMRKYGISRQ
jgi:transcriptional regulator with PAS, ATPase and Fis domain